MFFRSVVLAGLAALAAAQDIQILAPGGPDLWWVAQSSNNIVWNCQQTQFTNWTVVLVNSNVTVLNGALPIIAIEQSFNCPQLITTQLANPPPATGYTIQFANPLNNTQVYVQSQEFEVKALGSAYPASSATPTATGAGSSTSGSGSGSGSSTGSSPSQSSKSSASRLAYGSGIFGAALLGAAAFAL